LSAVRTKKGVFCAEESRGGAMTIDFCKKFGKEYADELFISNPRKILSSGKERENNE
jgi:hypothetical protein